MYISISYASSPLKQEDIEQGPSSKLSQIKIQSNTKELYSVQDRTLSNTKQQKYSWSSFGYECLCLFAAELPPILAYYSDQSKELALASLVFNVTSALIIIPKIKSEIDEIQEDNSYTLLKLVGGFSTIYSMSSSWMNYLNVKHNKINTYWRLENLVLTSLSAVTYSASALISYLYPKKKVS